MPATSVPLICFCPMVLVFKRGLHFESLYEASWQDYITDYGMCFSKMTMPLLRISSSKFQVMAELMVIISSTFPSHGDLIV
jgi:hypothetical protein